MSASQNEELLRAYQRELAYLRNMGAEFAVRYPKVASRLDLSADACADPHVERLIESFAFLTARLQHQMDSEFPEVTTALLGVLYPHFIQPVPAMAIARFEPDLDAGLPLSGHLIPRHTRLFTQTHSGLTCRFRTCFPVTLWPLKVTEARIESTDRYHFLDRSPDVAAVIRIRLQCQGAAFSDLDLKQLRFFLSGHSVYPLYELLTCNTLRVAVLDGEGPDAAPVYLPATAIRPVGFGPDEQVLPSPAQAHPGYRLLQEYFTFPEKFLFFDIDIPTVKTGAQTADLLILLNQGPRSSMVVSEDTFCLGCTPIINLFPKTTEPIRLDHRRHEYQLIPDKRLEATTEIHSILSVSASSDPNWTEVFEPFFSYTHPADGEHHRSFYHARRQPTGRNDIPGTDMFLSFLDLKFDPSEPPMQTVYAHTLCTNRELAAQMPAGAELQMEEGAPLRGITCLTKPTAQIHPPLGGEGLWLLISQLSLNHLSLAGGAESLIALREILRLYSFSTHSSNEQQIMGIAKLECRPVLRQLGTDAWRGFVQGIEVTLEFEETLYVGSSAILLSSVLSRFLGLYASINSFTQLVVRSKQRQGVWKRWQPMAGEQTVL